MAYLVHGKSGAWHVWCMAYLVHGMAEYMAYLVHGMAGWLAGPYPSSSRMRTAPTRMAWVTLLVYTLDSLNTALNKPFIVL